MHAERSNDTTRHLIGIIFVTSLIVFSTTGVAGQVAGDDLDDRNTLEYATAETYGDYDRSVDANLSAVDVESQWEEGETMSVYFNITANTSSAQKVALLRDGEVQNQNTFEVSENTSRYEIQHYLDQGTAEDEAKFNLTSFNDTASLSVDIATFERKLDKGWNAFSIPVAVEKGPTIAEVLPQEKIDSVWRYDEGQWQSYVPDAEQNPFNRLEGGQGYLVKTQSQFTVRPIVQNTVGGETITDSVPASESIDSGWNLVGHYWSVSQAASGSSALSSIRETHQGNVYRQSEPGEISFKPSQDFLPGESYWVLSNDNNEYVRSDSNPFNTGVAESENIIPRGNPDVGLQPEEKIAVPKLEFGQRYSETYQDSQQSKLSRNEFVDDTNTSLYINKSGDTQEICTGKNINNENEINCLYDTSNLSFGSYELLWNTTYRQGVQWRIVTDRLEKEPKDIPLAQTSVENGFEIDAGPVNLGLLGLQDQDINASVSIEFQEDSESLLNKSEFNRRVNTSVLIYESRPSGKLPVEESEKICEKSSLTSEQTSRDSTVEGTVECRIDTHNRQGDLWVQFNLTNTKTGVSKLVDTTTTILGSTKSRKLKILEETEEIGQEFSLPGYSAEITSTNLTTEIDNGQIEDDVLIVNGTISRTDAPNLGKHRIFATITGRERESITIDFGQGDRTSTNVRNRTPLENTETEVPLTQQSQNFSLRANIYDNQVPEYISLAVNDPRGVRTELINISERALGHLNLDSEVTNPKLSFGDYEETDIPVSVLSGRDLRLNITQNVSNPLHVNKEQFRDSAQATHYLLDERDLFLTEDEPDFLSDVRERTEENGDVGSVLDREYVSRVCQSEERDLNCTVSSEKLQAGRAYGLISDVEFNGRRRFVMSRFYATKEANGLGDPVSNDEIEIRLDQLSYTEPTATASSYLKNIDMTTADDNRTSVNFLLRDADLNYIFERENEAVETLHGPTSVRKGSEKTRDDSEDLDPATEPQYAVAWVETGQYGRERPTFLFER
jgi:hypothetical protein